MGGEFVDDFESADVGVEVSLEEEPEAPSDDFESVSFAPESFDSAASDPDFP